MSMVPEGQAGSRHKALHAVVQLDEQAALGHAGNAALVALAQVTAGVLCLIAVLGLALDLHCNDLALTGLLACLLGKVAVAQHHGILIHALELGGHDAMDGQIRIAADGAGEVSVVLQHQTVMTLGFLPHTAPWTYTATFRY